MTIEHTEKHGFIIISVYVARHSSLLRCYRSWEQKFKQKQTSCNVMQCKYLLWTHTHAFTQYSHTLCSVNKNLTWHQGKNNSGHKKEEFSVRFQCPKAVNSLKASRRQATRLEEGHCNGAAPKHGKHVTMVTVAGRGEGGPAQSRGGSRPEGRLCPLSHSRLGSVGLWFWRGWRGTGLSVRSPRPPTGRWCSSVWPLRCLRPQEQELFYRRHRALSSEWP